MARLSKSAKAKFGGKKAPISKEPSSGKLAMSLIARHGSPKEKAKLKGQLEKQYPGLVQKRDTGGTIANVGGWISDIYALLSQVGDAGKADYGERNQFGGIVNENKYRVGEFATQMIDPLGSAVKQLEKGNTGEALISLTGLGGITDALGITDMKDQDIAEAKLLEKKNINTMITSRAKQLNPAIQMVNENRLGQLKQGLKKGGTIHSKKMYTSGNVDNDKERGGKDNTLSGIQGETSAYLSPKSGSVLKKNKGGVVTGKGGVDTNLAKAKEGDFVIPRESVKNPNVKKIIGQLKLNHPLVKSKGGLVPVKLTAGEVLVPEGMRSRFEKLLKAPLSILAPNAEPGNGKVDGGEIDSKEEEKEKSNTINNSEKPKQLKKKKPVRTKESFLWKDGKAKNTSINKPDLIPSNKLSDIIERNNKKQTDMINLSSSSSPEEPTTPDKPVKGNNHNFEKITGAIQGIMGTLGASSLGDAPVKDVDRILEEDYTPALINIGLAALRENASYGMTPAVKSMVKRKNNEAYAMSVALGKETSAGSGTNQFNQNQASAVNKVNADANIEGQDQQMMDEKKGRFAAAAIGADPFLANLHSDKQRRKLIGTEMKQKLWDTQSNQYASLIGAGFANIMESERANRFWGQYSKYLNPTR